MTLQQIAQVLGAIGVIASLIYVAIQIRNNARAVRAATYQQLSASLATMWMNLSNNDEQLKKMLRGGDDFEALNRFEKASFRMAMMGYLRIYENAWFQRSIGTLRAKDWQAISSDMESIFSMPGMRAAWPLIKNRSGSDFAAHVDALVARLAAAKPN